LNKPMPDPYRAPPEPPEADEEIPPIAPLAVLVLLLGLLIALFAPRNRSDEPEPRGQALHHSSVHMHGGGHR
jgi:hypothetical protein